MSYSSLLSSEASLSSDSLDSFSNFNKLKPYNFEPTVSDNENTDGEASSSSEMRVLQMRVQTKKSVMQTMEAEK